MKKNTEARDEDAASGGWTVVSSRSSTHSLEVRGDLLSVEEEEKGEKRGHGIRRGGVGDRVEDMRFLLQTRRKLEMDMVGITETKNHQSTEENEVIGRLEKKRRSGCRNLRITVMTCEILKRALNAFQREMCIITAM